MLRVGLTLAAAVLVSGCALKKDVARVEQQVAVLEGRLVRQDSLRAAQLSEVIALQAVILDSIRAGRQALAAFRGEVDGDFYNLEQQLFQVQVLTGQSQQRLTELRTQIEDRGQQLAQDSAAFEAGAVTPSVDQMYDASLSQLRSGATTTARLGFQALLQQYPSSHRTADALYYVGETFAADSPDSAAVYYGRVSDGYPDSPRAPSALYKLGLLAERSGNTQQARDAYQRVTRDYPSSDEAALARDRLTALGQ